MHGMFAVRGTASALLTTHPPRVSTGCKSFCYSTVSFCLARQNAQAFNQPLAWDVSSVTSSVSMFYVHSSTCLRTACLTPPADARSISPPTVRLASPRSPGCIRFQPAACLGRLERDQYGWDVQGAQHCCCGAAQRLLNVTCHARSILPSPTVPLLAWHLAARTHFQSTACLECLKRDQHGPDVRGAHSAACLHTACPTKAKPTAATCKHHRHDTRSIWLHLVLPRLAWQDAQAFNQPLAWDVSNVTSMDHMFQVHTASCLHVAETITETPATMQVHLTSGSMHKLLTSRLLGTSRA